MLTGLLAALPQVLIRYAFAGVNASDVNFSSGRYFGRCAAAATRAPRLACRARPFSAAFGHEADVRIPRPKMDD